MASDMTLQSTVIKSSEFEFLPRLIISKQLIDYTLNSLIGTRLFPSVYPRYVRLSTRSYVFFIFHPVNSARFVQYSPGFILYVNKLCNDTFYESFALYSLETFKRATLDYFQN